MAEKRIKIIYETETVDLEHANALLAKCAASQDKATKEANDFGKASKKAGQDASKAFQNVNNESKKVNASLKNNEKGFISLSNVGVKAGARIGASLTAAFTVGAALALGKQIFDVTAEFQKFEAVLTNTLGSSKLAQAALVDIQEAGAKTNFSVSELTEAYVKFANRGLKLTQDEILKLSDIANSTGKSFDQLTEAVLDSFTGENERLKEFGITAKKTGETTQFTFKGITTEVENTQEAVQKYLLSLADLEGVSGTTASISATLEGRVSNLGDAFDKLFLNIGKGTTGVLPGLITWVTDFTNLVADSFKSVEQIKKEVSALSLSKSIQGDIQEVNALATAYEKNGKTIEEATAKAAKNVINSLKNLRDSWDFVGDRADINERIKNIEKTFIAQKQTADSELGLLERLRKELKVLNEEREKAQSAAEVKTFNKRIKQKQDEIDALLGVQKQAEKTKVVLEQLNALDTTTLAKAYQILYNEQVKGNFEVSDAIENTNTKYLNTIEQQILARASQVAKDSAAAEKADKEAEERLKKRMHLLQEYTSASVDLVNSFTAYQNQLDENRINKLEKAKEKELAVAGQNSNARVKIEQDYDARVRALRRKQAQRDKNIATFNATINTIQGFTKAIAEGGLPGLLLGGLVLAAGYAQVRQIQSQEIPEFNKGTKSVPGPASNKDTVYAKLTPGEMVVNKETKKKYWPVLNKIFDHKIDPKLLNDIARNQYSGGSVAVINDNKELARLWEEKPVQEWNVSDDEIVRTVRKKNSRTTFIGERYRSKGR